MQFAKLASKVSINDGAFDGTLSIVLEYSVNFKLWGLLSCLIYCLHEGDYAVLQLAMKLRF